MEIKQMKFRLTSPKYYGEYYFNTRLECEQKAAVLGWREYAILLMEINI